MGVRLGARRSYGKKLLFQGLLVLFLALNGVSYLGAYTLTHFRPPGQRGWGLARPTNTRRPQDVGLTATTQRIPMGRAAWLETWLIPAPEPRGTVLLFPGNGGTKGKQLLAPAQVFHRLGYSTLLVDFRGVGGSSGNTTTLGVREAQDVALAFKYAQSTNLPRPWVLYGLSMGSAAILKAIAQERIQPDAIILELPFARLLSAVRSRLRVVGLPPFPLAELLVFWGSVQHGFNGFTHHPVADAQRVRCAALILHGQKDRWTTVGEIREIFGNLRGVKQLRLFPEAGHGLLVTLDPTTWQSTVRQFLEQR